MMTSVTVSSLFGGRGEAIWIMRVKITALDTTNYCAPSQDWFNINHP